MKIISFDQATHITGYAIYNDGELAGFGIIRSKATDPHVRMRDMFEQISALIDQETPNYVSIEGTQCQNGNYKAFSTLCQMQGVLFAILFIRHIEFFVVPPMTWKAFHKIGNGKRALQKRAAIQIVHNKGIDASEDECEAILQGEYVLDLIRKEQK